METATTPDYLTQFQREGYCIVDDIYSKDEIDEMETFFDDYISNGLPVFSNGDTKASDVDPKKEILRAMHPHRHAERPKQWMMHPNIVEVLTHLFGREPLGAQTMYYYKPPGSVGQGMHQDNFYLLTSPQPCIGAWTPIDDADTENGCLHLIPRTQGKGIICKDTGESWKGLHTHMKGIEDLKPIPVTVKRGQTLFFHGELPHGSGPNHSKTRSRRTFIGHYCAEATKEISKFYFPILDKDFNEVSGIHEYAGGGPCQDGWQGSTH